MDELNTLKEKGLLRELRRMEHKGNYIKYQDEWYLNLSSNDYLGIANRIDWQAEFLDSLPPNSFVMGATSSRLLTGNSPVKEDFEFFLKTLYNREACLLFNSGYHANTGILSALTSKNDLILADKLVHASIIDGLKLCACEWKRFKHNDYNDLERLLKSADANYNQIYVVTESVFSMDGDCADLDSLIELKKKYDFKTYIDEAHGLGIKGKRGLGLCEEKKYLQEIDMIVGTFGKALASEGAFVICDEDVKQLLINKSRSLIFTTASSPITTRWTRFVFEKMIDMQEQRRYLASISRLFRDKLSSFNMLGDTQIIPLVFDNNRDCLEYSDFLRANKIWAAPVRYPSVPQNQPRIRFSLTASLTEQEIKTVYESILAYKRK